MKLQIRFPESEIFICIWLSIAGNDESHFEESAAGSKAGRHCDTDAWR